MHQPVVRVGTPVAVERPRLPYVVDETEVEVADEQFLLLVGGDVADELAARVDEVAGAVEVVVPVLLLSDAIDGGDVVEVGDGGRGLLQLPEVGGQAAVGGGGL